MSRPHTVLIAAPHLLSALTARMKQEGGEWIAFTDTDALKALDVITRQRPDVVALERLFADTPRGIALIQRIKADPALAALVIRIVSLDAQATDTPVPSPSDETRKPTAGAAVAAVLPSAGPLDARGTRRVPRFKVASSLEVLVDGNRSSLIDLSTSGAQVVSQIVLKPNQRVRVSFYDDHGTVRVGAMIAWASFEMPPDSGPRYRVGLEFVAADPRAIEAYLLRHKA